MGDCDQLTVKKKQIRGTKMTDFYPVVNSAWKKQNSFQNLKKIKKMSKRICYMYDNGLYTDVTFFLGLNQVCALKAHKFVLLASGSAVFSDLFISKHFDEIYLPEIDHDAFLTVIRFLYKNEVFFSCIEEAVYIHRTSTVLSLEKLLAKCNKFILSYNVKPTGVFDLLKLAHQFKVEALIKKCLFVICNEADAVLSNLECKANDYPIICYLLKIGHLNVESEYQLFFKIARCLKLSCSHLKLNMSFLLPHFRFLSMSEKQFQDIINVFSSFFTIPEKTSILHAIINPSARHGIPSWCNSCTDKRVLTVHNFWSSTENYESNTIKNMEVKKDTDSNVQSKDPKCLMSVSIMLEEDDVEICSFGLEKALKPSNISCLLEIASTCKYTLHGVRLKWKIDDLYSGPRTLYCNLMLYYEGCLLFQTLWNCVDGGDEISLLFEIPLDLPPGTYSIKVCLNHVRGFTFYKFAAVTNSQEFLNLNIKGGDSLFFISEVFYSFRNPIVD